MDSYERKQHHAGCQDSIHHHRHHPDRPILAQGVAGQQRPDQDLVQPSPGDGPAAQGRQQGQPAAVLEAGLLLMATQKARLLQLQSYQSLVAQIDVELAKYVDDFAAPLITAGQEQIANLALNDAAQATQMSLFTSGTLGANFNRLPVGATEFMVGLAGDGSPLVELLEKRIVGDPSIIVNITDTLVESTALGVNPTVTARLIRENLAGGLNKALQIARSEQLRVYRESSRLQYEESGVVSGYMRLSAKDDRVCPACLMADGMIVKLSTAFAEHVQGRCSLVPIVIGADDPKWETGEEWFRRQPADVQSRILGPGRFDAWQDNQFELDELITRRSSSVWGKSLVPTPLKDLVN